MNDGLVDKNHEKVTEHPTFPRVDAQGRVVFSNFNLGIGLLGVREVAVIGKEPNRRIEVPLASLINDMQLINWKVMEPVPGLIQTDEFHPGWTHIDRWIEVVRRGLILGISMRPCADIA